MEKASVAHDSSNSRNSISKDGSCGFEKRVEYEFAGDQFCSVSHLLLPLHRELHDVRDWYSFLFPWCLVECHLRV